MNIYFIPVIKAVHLLCLHESRYSHSGFVEDSRLPEC